MAPVVEEYVVVRADALWGSQVFPGPVTVGYSEISVGPFGGCAGPIVPVFV